MALVAPLVLSNVAMLLLLFVLSSEQWHATAGAEQWHILTFCSISYLAQHPLPAGGTPDINITVLVGYIGYLLETLDTF